MERVASLLERQMSSARLQQSLPAEEGPSQRLLTSPSVDSMHSLRSPGTQTPNNLEVWPPHEILPVVDLESSLASQHISSPFAAAAQMPLEETEAVILTRGQNFHALAQPSSHRVAVAMKSLKGPEAARQWKEQTTFLLIWMAAGLVSCFMSLFWNPLGVWAGVMAVFGALLAVFGIFLEMEVAVNLQATRIFAIVTGVLDLSAVVLWLIFLCRLPCPKSLREAGRCKIFRTAMAAMMGWFSVKLVIAISVAARATRIKTLIDPIVRQNVIVLQTARSTPA